MDCTRAPLLALCVALLATPLARRAGAEAIEGVGFAERIERAGTPLALRGLGLLRYRILFKGYVAALYLPPEVPTGKVLDDVPRRLEIHYFWSIPGDRFGPAAEQVLAGSLPAGQLEALRERLERLHALYRDVEPGDRYALTYLPERGTELSLNGEPLGSVPGADFAAAYFSIWLGERPLDESLRDQLLAGRRDPS